MKKKKRKNERYEEENTERLALCYPHIKHQEFSESSKVNYSWCIVMHIGVGNYKLHVGYIPAFQKCFN